MFITPELNLAWTDY